MKSGHRFALRSVITLLRAFRPGPRDEGDHRRQQGPDSTRFAGGRSLSGGSDVALSGSELHELHPDQLAVLDSSVYRLALPIINFAAYGAAPTLRFIREGCKERGARGMVDPWPRVPCRWLSLTSTVVRRHS
jgi:hypothetical protein